MWKREVIMVKRQTIGENPLDAWTEQKAINGMSATAVIEEETFPIQKKARGQKKRRITVQISEDVIERVKNAVYWTPGLTLASLAEKALAEAVGQLEKGKGTSFPRRKEELKTGRPIN
jgi:predicted DNA binding CopG/RHH family protein